MMNIKPIVRYDAARDHIVAVGSRAIIFPVDHPGQPLVSNTSHVITSIVICYNPETGEFETENTVYKLLEN